MKKQNNTTNLMKKTELKMIDTNLLLTLKRNPQYLTPKQMESLKASIQRDGFCVPILVRAHRHGKFEIVSGNHSYMAAVELKMAAVPCVVVAMSERDAKRLAVNLNTIHGEPNAELLAPFLADMDESLLREIHLEDGVIGELLEFDNELSERLIELQAPEKMDRESPKHKNHVCECPKCGRRHLKPNEDNV